MSIFEIISQCLNFLISFLPRYTIIKTTHEGVKFVHGNDIHKLTCQNGIWGSGIHVYWPLVTEVIQAPIKRQSTRLEKQILTTLDGHTVLVTGILVYEVFDIVSLLTETWDYDDTIKDYATVAIMDAITSNIFEEITSIDLSEELKKNLEPFGINVIRMNFCDCATGRPILHLGIVNEHNFYGQHEPH